MTIRDEFRFLCQIQGKAPHYTQISVTVEKMPEAAGKSELTLAFSHADDDHPAVRLGALYFFDHYALHYPGGLMLTIRRVQSMPLGPDNTAVFYATVMALSQALAFRIGGFELNMEKGVLSLPFPI